MLTVLDYLTVSDKRLFVADETTGNVYKIALHDNALPSNTDVPIFASEPAAHGVVMDPASGLAYVTRSEANTVDIFDPEKMNSIKRIAVAGDADAIVFDSFRDIVYVANEDTPDTYHALDSVKLHYGAHTLTVDPATHTLYVAYASLFVRPRVAVFVPRGVLLPPVMRCGPLHHVQHDSSG